MAAVTAPELAAQQDTPLQEREGTEGRKGGKGEEGREKRERVGQKRYCTSCFGSSQEKCSNLLCWADTVQPCSAVWCAAVEFLGHKSAPISTSISTVGTAVSQGTAGTLHSTRLDKREDNKKMSSPPPPPPHPTPHQAVSPGPGHA